MVTFLVAANLKHRPMRTALSIPLIAVPVNSGPFNLRRTNKVRLQSRKHSPQNMSDISLRQHRVALNLAFIVPVWYSADLSSSAPSPGGYHGVVVALVGIVVYVVAYLFAQGGTVYAVSELYLRRSATVSESLGRMRGQAANLFGVSMLNGLAIGAATLLLIVPGIYVACRLITCIPAALLENLGARESLDRSFALTKGFAGRSFVIYLLYFALLYGAILLFEFPFLIAIGLSAKNPQMMWTWMAFAQVGGFWATVLITPIFTIAAAVFYYDLRARKEAFDLQLMMNPSGNISPTGVGIPSMLS